MGNGIGFKDFPKSGIQQKTSHHKMAPHQRAWICLH